MYDLIGVKSKYGSCKGTCMGWINLTKIKFVNLFKVMVINPTGSIPDKDIYYY